MRPKLTLVAGRADKAEIRIKLPTIVGRARNAGLMIGHKTVSRRHCELFERQGMLYVRDTGSRNGTLVDNEPIKEAVLKPGHTLTIGPLTFRADYEPSDAFIRGDEPGTPSGAAQTMADAGSLKAQTATTQGKPAPSADTPKSGEVKLEVGDFADFGEDDLALSDLGADHVELTVEDEPASDDKSAAAPTVASALDEADDALVFDEADLAFDDMTDTAPTKPAAAEPASNAPAAEAPAAKDDDALGEIGGEEDFLTFDLGDEPEVSSGAEASGEEMAEPSLDIDDLDLAAAIDVGQSAPSKEPEKASGGAADLELDFDDAGFTLEDLEDTSPAPEPAAAEESAEDDEILEFEIAEPEPPAPAPKAASNGGASKKPSGKPAEGNGKLPLGEEKPSGGDAGASAFMKELGL